MVANPSTVAPKIPTKAERRKATQGDAARAYLSGWCRVNGF